MEEVLDKFRFLVEEPYSYLTKWKKESGKQVIGCFPMYIPEEIIHAAGMLPVILLGSGEEITMADQYTQISICRLARSNFDLCLKGKFVFLDGVVFSDFCLTTQMLADIWRFHKSGNFFHQLLIPRYVGATKARNHILSEYEGLKAALEKLAGREITESSLRKSISVFNENRKLLHRLYQVRRANPGLFRARDLANIVAAGMLMDKEEHSRLLCELLERVPAQPASAKGTLRLVLSGFLCTMPELNVLDMIEEMGTVLSDDDLYVGRRYFHTLTSETINPMEALAQRYINDVPCPIKIDPKIDWAGYLANLAKEAKADGVVSMAVQFCEGHLYDLPFLSENLSRMGIPNFVIEKSHSGATGQLRTRLQAFIETLGGNDEN